MAVYKRNYKPYEGRLTPDWSRFLVPSRYALETLFQSRLLIGFMVASYIVPIFAATVIYLHHNLSALTLLRINPDDLLPIDGDFFGAFLSFQGALAFILTAYAGPGLVSPDLSNNALPLYLCRPINRTEYILGKMAVLFIPLSCITWVPGLAAVRNSGRLAGTRLGLGSHSICVGDLRGFLGMDHAACSAGSRAVGLGAMEARGQRSSLRSFLHLLGARRDGQ